MRKKQATATTLKKGLFASEMLSSCWNTIQLCTRLVDVKYLEFH